MMEKRNPGVGRRASATAGRLGLPILGFILAALAMGGILTGCSGGSGSVDTPVYHALGVGVIIQSRSDIKASSMAAKNAAFDPGEKQIDLAPVYGGVGIRSVSLTRAAGVDAAFLASHVSFVLLTWEPVSGAGHYQVKYHDTVIWDSGTVNTAVDPAFSAANPEAYLDLEYELKEITAPGQYQFQIIALSGSTVVYQFATVTAALGLTLDSLPAIDYSAPNLSWSGVTGATEYKITLGGINPFIVSNSIVTYDVSKKIPTPASIYYKVYVDARITDANGNPIEITRGSYGLTY